MQDNHHCKAGSTEIKLPSQIAKQILQCFAENSEKLKKFGVQSNQSQGFLQTIKSLSFSQQFYKPQSFVKENNQQLSKQNSLNDCVSTTADSLDQGCQSQQNCIFQKSVSTTNNINSLREIPQNNLALHDKFQKLCHNKSELYSHRIVSSSVDISADNQFNSMKSTSSRSFTNLCKTDHSRIQKLRQIQQNLIQDKSVTDLSLKKKNSLERFKLYQTITPQQIQNDNQPEEQEEIDQNPIQQFNSMNNSNIQNGNTNFNSYIQTDKRSQSQYNRMPESYANQKPNIPFFACQNYKEQSKMTNSLVENVGDGKVKKEFYQKYKKQNSVAQSFSEYQFRQLAKPIQNIENDTNANSYNTFNNNSNIYINSNVNYNDNTNSNYNSATIICPNNNLSSNRNSNYFNLNNYYVGNSSSGYCHTWQTNKKPSCSQMLQKPLNNIQNYGAHYNLTQLNHPKGVENQKNRGQVQSPFRQFEGSYYGNHAKKANNIISQNFQKKSKQPSTSKVYSNTIRKQGAQCFMKIYGK